MSMRLKPTGGLEVKWRELFLLTDQQLKGYQEGLRENSVGHDSKYWHCPGCGGKRKKQPAVQREVGVTLAS